MVDVKRVNLRQGLRKCRSTMYTIGIFIVKSDYPILLWQLFDRKSTKGKLLERYVSRHRDKSGTFKNSFSMKTGAKGK